MRKFIVLLGFVAVGLVACQAPTPSAPLPTIAMLPTWTPSPTPLPPTATLTASNTPTPTTTRTPTVTASPTATATLTPSITPTNTLTFTPSNTPTATDTPTPTATPTSLVPMISRLEISPEEVEIGDTVILQWIAQGDDIQLAIQDQTGSVVNQVELPPRGSQPFIVDASQRNVMVFRMTVTRSGISVTQSVAVDVGCASLWFFDAAGLISRKTCPADGPTTSTGRVQVFERGYMVWVPQRSRVYALYGGLEGGTFSELSLTSPTSPLPGAPTGQFQPGFEFEGAWLETSAANGNTWRDQIGFGTQPAQATPITLQRVQDSDAFFLRVGDPFLFQLQPAESGTVGTWLRLRE